ncbi:MAG: arginine deiminase [Clostridia bacterium]
MGDYFINLNSEIGKLKTVMLHRPGVEVEMLNPNYLEHMLSEDTPHVPTAQREHDAFASLLRENGVEVLYLEQLFLEAMNETVHMNEFIEDYIKIADIGAETLKDCIRDYLKKKGAKQLFYEVCKGILRTDLMDISDKPLPLMINDDYPFFTDPLSSMYFTRDISICVKNGMIVSSMSMPFRRREALLMRYIHKYNPRFANVKLYYDYNLGYSIEGGDCLVLSNKVIAIGFSQRTSIGAIEDFAKKILSDGYEKLIVFNLPKSRRFMHLDVICTMVDYDKFIAAPEVYDGAFDVYELTLVNGRIEADARTEPLGTIFARALNLPAVQFIKCGGGDKLTAAREHWNMGSNSLTIAPGEVITYDRNDITNDLLVKAGVKVHTIIGSELSRGRGGPRCMSMPIYRVDL